jgi:hypothetical protein
MRVLAAARSIPGVTVAGATDAPLLRNMLWADGTWTPPAGARPAGYLSVHGVTSGFFDVVHPRLLKGRLPSAAELDDGRHVVVVSESIAKAFWPSQSAIGQPLAYSSDEGQLLSFVVLGVVADARLAGWDEARFQQIYAPVTALRRGSGSPSLLMRATSTGSVLAELQRFMRAEGTDVRAIRAMPLDTMLAETVRLRRFHSWLFGSFAAAALAIMGLGVLGLMAMSAARRTREVGLRMALGATRDGIVRLFVREQAAAVVAGGLLGLAASAWTVRFLKSSLYGLTIWDARAWIAALLLVAATALCGTLIPAIRASRADPATALRVD